MNEEKIKIMVGVATYPGHSYIRDRFKSHLDALIKATNYPTHVVILWNGDGRPEWYYKEYDCQKMSFKFGIKGIQILEQKHNRLRKIFLRSDCSHFFMLESDNLPPPDTLNRLIAHNVDIVQGTYFVRAEQSIKHFLSDTQENRIKYGELAGNWIYVIKASDTPCFWIYENGKCRMAKIEDIIPPRGLIEVYAGSMGSTLIKRKVLEKITFRIMDEKIQQFTDFLFWHDARIWGYKGYTDTELLIGHVHPKDELHDQEKWFKAETLEAL